MWWLSLLRVADVDLLVRSPAEGRPGSSDIYESSLPEVFTSPGEQT